MSDKYQGIIFDFNGVLLWDSHLHEKAWNDFSLTSRGYALNPDEIFGQVHGRTNRSVLEFLLNRQISSQEFEKLSRQKETIYQNLCLEKMEEFQLSPGAIKLFDFLIDHDIPHTIATAADKFNLDFYVDHLKLDRWFDVSSIVYDNGTFPGKPAPDMYLRAAKNINVTPDKCVVIEDSKSGLMAAINAKIGKIIGLAPPGKENQLLNIKGVSEVIPSLLQLKKEKMFATP
jgi:beta-phosphoglucomutase-like phosphatase (HAD superfamily)